jgi:FkbM family methyltransferase
VNFLKRYLRFHLDILLAVYKKLLLKTDKRTFAFLFNLKSVLLNSPSRLSWQGENFLVTDSGLPEFQYKIRHQRQCNMAYEFGIKKRAANLADCYFLNKIDFQDNDTFLDCGANVGDLKIWFELHSKKINYVGFEPSPTEFRCLQDNVNPSQVYNVGLWNKEGELEFYISSQGGDSSLIEPKKFDEKIISRVTRLEEYVTSPIKCLKLEAEGAEPEILEGLGDKLNLIEFISADLGYERGIASESTLVPVTNFLLAKGFELIEVTQGRICALYRNKSKLEKIKDIDKL